MTPERYQLIDQIFQSALEIDPAGRKAFLDEVCSGDGALRSEVEALLTSDHSGLNYIDQPAFDIATQFFTSAEPQLSPGTRIDRYEILALLGRGGMGEVYLARDEKLNRKIALKLLPSDFTSEELSFRFLQEARAASAFNHPNIITIHEIGDVEGRHFIATEFIDGQTLRQRLRESPLSIDESLDVAIQICSALSAAHQAHIVHRDIKPENIMLRRDGHIKVLDFGLAKLTEQSDRATEVGTVDRVNASSGLLMGTVRYMSPEQASGQPVDSRSDIFSLGVVLYEMLAGRPPFGGEDGREILKTILSEDPQPLEVHLSSAPEKLQRIVSKSLLKDKGERYQSAEEMLADLIGLKESGNSILGYVTTQGQQHKVAAALIVTALAVIVGGLGYGAYRFVRSRHAPFQNISVTKLTNFDDAWQPAISPDGKYVAYVKGKTTTGSGKNSLWLRTIGTSNERVLVPAADVITYAKFLSDGEHVAYQTAGGSFVVPISGGAPTKLPTKGVVLSPDGRRVAYLDNRITEGRTTLVVANSDGTGMQDITTRQAPNYYWTAVRASWSPDGKLIACVAQNGNESFPHVFVINLDTRTEVPLTNQRWTAISGLAWLPNMEGLMAVASEETSSTMQVWEIYYPSGEARRITNDTVNYFGLSLTADGKTVVTTKADVPTSLWLMPVETSSSSSAKSSILSIDATQAHQINVTNLSTNQFALNARLSWTPDGRRIVYMSEESGNADIWSMNTDGSDRRQLTTDPHWDTAGVVSPDAHHIAFMSNRAGAENIWLMDLNGENQTRLTSKLVERHPVFSADSRWVYFVSWETGKATIWKVPVEGGQPTQVISDLSFSPALSPDGRFLLYAVPPPLGRSFMTSADGGPPIKTFERAGIFSWTPDGRALVFRWPNNNVSNLWEQPLDGSEPRQLTNFSPPGVYQYEFSPDGKQLVVARTTFTSDIVLIRETW